MTAAIAIFLLEACLTFQNIPPSGSSGRVDTGMKRFTIKSCPEWVRATSHDGKTLCLEITSNEGREPRKGTIELSAFLSRKCISIIQGPIAVPVGTGINYGNSFPATDDLGRTIPTADEAGPPRERYVAMFYWIWHEWHNSNKALHKAVIPSQVIEEHPDAAYDFDHPAWEGHTGPFWWGEPLFGFYLDSDEWVLLRHAKMLADAGVDVIVFDATNATLTFDETWPVLCNVFTKARANGIKTPQIAFHLPFSASNNAYISLVNLYKKLYKPGTWSELFFLWEGKPLIMAYPSVLDKTAPNGDIPAINEEIKDYFTFRPGQSSYTKGSRKKLNQWGWLQVSPQNGFGLKDGRPEEMPVGTAQNHADGKLSAMNTPGAFGRSHKRNGGFETDSLGRGWNFQEQWDEALVQDPSLVFVTGWNEWIMGRYREWCGQPNAFPDQFDMEHSRDIEPMKGGHADNYYYQLVSNIRRFKGMQQLPSTGCTASISIDGDFSDWWNVRNEYRDMRGDTIQRDHDGWGGIKYTDASGRNDIVLTKVADDNENIYFYVACADAISPDSDPAWMRLFIDSDSNWSTGWNGYDFIVNRVSPIDGIAVLESSSNDWNWTAQSDISYRIMGREMELAIPKSALRIGQGRFSLAFKWSDNMQKDGDISDFLVSGDVAPEGRFNYVYEN